MVFTRSTDEAAGRVKSMLAIEAALSESFDVTVFRLHSVLETRRIVDVAWALATWMISLLQLRPMALQCALFATTRDCRLVLQEITRGQFDAVYVDMVRSQYFLRRLRATQPALRIVTDLDDLISRRMRLWGEAGLPLSVGFMGRFLPKLAQRLIESILPSRLIQRYEAVGLIRAECEMTTASDAVVLVSDAERDILREAVHAAVGGRIHAITPPCVVSPAPACSQPVMRFIFVGSDAYQPNRIAIDFLLAQWRTLHPAFELHIYGRQRRQPSYVSRVHWHGFVDDVAEAYLPGSIALAPLPIAGGIKTKVVEAWAFGCPVLATPEALEGLCGQEYPLMVHLGDWSDYLVSPESKQSTWESAARIGRKIVMDKLTVEAFRSAWRAMFLPLSPGSVR